MQTQWAKRDLIVTCTCGKWALTICHVGHLTEAEKMKQANDNWQLHRERSHRVDQQAKS